MAKPYLMHVTGRESSLRGGTASLAAASLIGDAEGCRCRAESAPSSPSFDPSDPALGHYERTYIPPCKKDLNVHDSGAVASVAGRADFGVSARVASSRNSYISKILCRYFAMFFSSLSSRHVDSEVCCFGILQE